MKGKMITIFIALLIISVIGGFIMLNIKLKKVEIKKIKSFSFGYSISMMINGNISYEYKCGERCLVSVKPNEVNRDDPTIVEVDEEFGKKLEELLKKYDVGKWDGFNKSDHNVLDGNSFHLSVTMEDDQNISASGYMMYPKNYRDFSSELSSLFEPLYDPDSKEKVKVKVDETEYDFLLEDNDAAKEFVNLFPFVYEEDVENYRRMNKELDVELPLDDKEWSFVNRGDVLLKDGKTLVILVDDYMESGVYTKIGHINDFPRINKQHCKIEF